MDGWGINEKLEEKNAIRVAKPHNLLQLEDNTILGMDVRYILTPGHTKGSMCILLDNILFTGDT